MKTCIIYPTRESEKAISGYSENLVKSFRSLDVDSLTYQAGNPKSFFKLISRLRSYDIVHIQHEYNLLGHYGLPFFWAYFLLLRQRKKIVTTMHTIISKKQDFNENRIKTFLRKILYSFQNKLINSASSAIVVHSEFFKDILNEEYKIKREKILVIPQGILDIKRISRDKARKDLNLPLLENVYIMIGNLVPDHGADIIIKQADKIDGKIIIVANSKAVNDRNQERLDSYRNYCKKIVEENNSENVIFDIGEISDVGKKWWEYFFAADFVLQPYRGGIGSGIFTHAIAAQTPVIASDIPFFKEISERYDCVGVADKDNYSEAIKESLKKNNYRKMKAGCKKYKEDNNWLKIAKSYESLYSSL